MQRSVPVRTTLPETKISRTIFGTFILYMRPGNSSGSYCRHNTTFYTFAPKQTGKVCVTLARILGKGLLTAMVHKHTE